MKNLELWPREIDRKGLLVLAFVFSAGLGFVVPVPDLAGDLRTRLVDAFITLSGGVFAWAVFRLIEPRRFSRAWATARVVGTPVLWVVVVAGLAIFLCRWHQAQEDQMDNRRNRLATQIAQA